MEEEQLTKTGNRLGRNQIMVFEKLAKYTT
jgi:hypothetical protein